MKSNSQAFTLIELLMVLALVAMLSLLAVFGWQKWFRQQERQWVAAKLLQALNFAKLAALSYHQQITVCAAASAVSCGDDWSKGLLIFLDPDNRQQPAAKAVLMRLPSLTQQSLVWRGWLGHHVIRFESDGLTHSYHGSFYFGATQQQQPLLVINAVGRARIT